MNTATGRKRWTDDDTQLLTERFQSCTIEELADTIGCSESTISKHARSLGLKKDNPYGRNHEARAFIEMEYDNLTYGELCKQTGLSRNGIRLIARELGLERTKEQLSAMQSKALKETWGRERARATFGLEQRTKLRVFGNKKKRDFRSNIKRVGYIVMRGANVIYYSEDLVRRPKRESYGMKLGMEFKPLPAMCAEET